MVTRLQRHAAPLTVLLPFGRDVGMLATSLTAVSAVHEFRELRVRCATMTRGRVYQRQCP